MAALLSTELSNTDNIVKYLSEAKGMGIAVLPPTVNESELSFSVPGGKIRFGLGAIKGLAEGDRGDHRRAPKGPFTSLYDFCERVSQKHINKKGLETIVRAGAFDCFTKPRAQLMEALDRAIDAAKSMQKEAASGQASLFSAPAFAASVKPREISGRTTEWPELERLKLEKEAMAAYVRGHPLNRYAAELKRYTSATIASLSNQHPRRQRGRARRVNHLGARAAAQGRLGADGLRGPRRSDRRGRDHGRLAGLRRGDAAEVRGPAPGEVLGRRRSRRGSHDFARAGGRGARLGAGPRRRDQDGRGHPGRRSGRQRQAGQAEAGARAKRREM